jgi:hypothetical protein
MTEDNQELMRIVHEMAKNMVVFITEVGADFDELEQLLQEEIVKRQELEARVDKLTDNVQ